jgi:hypothetical protein
VELGTGKPLYAHREGTSIDDGRYWVDYEPRDFPGHYGMQLRIDVEALKKEYDQALALSPEQAMAAYRDQERGSPPLPSVDAATIQTVLGAMNERGAWVEDLSAVDYADWKFKPRRRFRGISTHTYTKNMTILINYLKTREK